MCTICCGLWSSRIHSGSDKYHRHGSSLCNFKIIAASAVAIFLFFQAFSMWRMQPTPGNGPAASHLHLINVEDDSDGLQKQVDNGHAAQNVQPAEKGDDALGKPAVPLNSDTVKLTRGVRASQRDAYLAAAATFSCLVQGTHQVAFSSQSLPNC